MNDQKPQLFDSKTVIALVMTAGVFFAWQTYMSKKYPPLVKPVNVAATTAPEAPTAGVGTPTSEATLSAAGNKAGTASVEAKNTVQETLVSFDTELTSFQISNLGFGIRNFRIKSYVDKDKNPITLGSENVGDLFVLSYGDAPVIFDVKEVSFGHFEGISKVAGATIKRTLIYDPLKYSFESKIEIADGDADFYKKNLKLVIPDQIHVIKSTGFFAFLFPSFDHQDFVTTEFDKTIHTNIDKHKENISQEIKVAQLAGIGTQYFAVGALDKSSVAPSLKLTSDWGKERASVQMVYGELRASSMTTLDQVFYIGPKSFDILKSVDERLVQLIDYGMFGFIAKPMLFGMKWFYSLVGNWGVAIILLTLLVRLLVLPLYLMSVRSMKGMQKIQPRMKELQERHKSDPMTMNKEVWALMKQEKASPFGGCLPMLLQIPIFFALYRVISTSIELHQSPFALWIRDLSAYDHFYVLPILMGLTMFIQQKITPTTMDPQQAKILAFMPLVFTVFMISLPSGLTLYMFISSLFGIIQQLILVPRPAQAQKI